MDEDIPLRASILDKMVTLIRSVRADEWPAGSGSGWRQG
jgi:hypothetical protein